MRYAVVGASHGTGKALVAQLAARGDSVRAISRNPGEPNPSVEPFAADVTNATAITHALDGDFGAVFFTVDIHGLFNSRDQVRDVMFQGCVNVIRAAEAASRPKFILLSVIGSDRPSWVWSLLNAVKRGMKRNVIDREEVLKASQLPYVICRAPKLGDGDGGHRLAASAPVHKLNMKMGIDRIDLARAMIAAADGAPAGSVWDVFADSAAPTPAWLLISGGQAGSPTADISARE